MNELRVYAAQEVPMCDMERMEALLQLTPAERLRLNDLEVQIAYLSLVRDHDGLHGRTTFRSTDVALDALVGHRRAGGLLADFLAASPQVGRWRAAVEILWQSDGHMLERLIAYGPPPPGTYTNL